MEDELENYYQILCHQKGSFQWIYDLVNENVSEQEIWGIADDLATTTYDSVQVYKIGWIGNDMLMFDWQNGKQVYYHNDSIYKH